MFHPIISPEPDTWLSYLSLRPAALALTYLRGSAYANAQVSAPAPSLTLQNVLPWFCSAHVPGYWTFTRYPGNLAARLIKHLAVELHDRFNLALDSIS